jgi:hypothetical protein
MNCAPPILNQDISQWSIEKQAQSLGCGLNISLDNSDTRDLSHLQPVIDSCIYKASRLGFRSIRISANWLEHTLSAAPYTIEPAFLSTIDHTIKQIKSYNLSTIISQDFSDNLFTVQPPSQELFSAVWAQIALRYKDSDTSLYFEITSPSSTHISNELWTSFCNEAISRIRKSNPYRSLIVQVPYAEGTNFGTNNKIAVDSFTIMSFKYFNPIQFTHQGLTLTGMPSQCKGTPWPLSASDTIRIKTEFDAVHNSPPVFISEFGASDSADMTSRIKWNSAVSKQCRSHHLSMAYSPFCTIEKLTEQLSSDSLKLLFNAVLIPENLSAPPLTSDSSDTTLPHGDYVLLDDFENIFKAQPGMNFLGAARQFAQNTTFKKSGWYAMGNDSTIVYSFDSVPLLKWDEWYKKELEHNGALLIGPYGLSGNGVYGRYHVKSVGESYAFAGCGTSFCGEYYTNKIDFTNLQAVTFWARGKGTWRVMFLTDTIDQGYAPKDQWGHFGTDFELNDSWKQYVFWTKNFKPMEYSRAKKEKLQWSEACKKSTFFEIVTSQNYGQDVDEMLELQVDEIRLYGVSYEKTFGFTYKNPEVD